MEVIKFDHYTKSSKEFTLHNLNFSMNQGYITGIIGPNGSGKTSIIRSIMNLDRPDQGEVLVFGQSYRTEERKIKRRIGFVYDEPYFYDHLTLNEMKKIVASFYPTWKESLFQKYRDQFELSGKQNMNRLSKGMKTKFSLATALAHEPELLIMDEPTAGLDPVFRREILAILTAYIGEGERSVVFSTHISTDLERIADFIVYIRKGQIHFNGSKEQLLDAYWLVQGSKELLHSCKLPLIGMRHTAFGFEGLLPAHSCSDTQLNSLASVEKPTLEDILVFTKEGE
jgi:ABC-2 type transport system ATP-binding protein